MSVSSREICIAVFEKEPDWGPELQRQFQQSAVAIRECRAIRDLIPAIEGCERSVLVVDLTESMPECIDWLTNQVVNFPYDLRIIVIGSPATSELEWLLRGAGVTAYLPDRISGADLARLCRRQMGLRNGPTNVGFGTAPPEGEQTDLPSADD